MGIGNKVSTAVVEGIARAGNGKSLFTVENDSMVDKCAALLRAVFPCVKDVTIDWGTPGSIQSPADAPFSVHLSDSVSVHFKPPPSVRQSPNWISDIYPGVRFTVFALTTHRTIPKQIILRGKRSDRDEHITFVVQVSSVKIFGEKHLTPLHTLSARRLIDDLIEDRTTLPETINHANAEDVRRAAVVHLGEQYQLASRYTSFVAVYDETKVLPLSSTDDEVPIGDDNSSGASFVTQSVTESQLGNHGFLTAENGVELHVSDERLEEWPGDEQSEENMSVKRKQEILGLDTTWQADESQETQQDKERTEALIQEARRQMKVRRMEKQRQEAERPVKWEKDNLEKEEMEHQQGMQKEELIQNETQQDVERPAKWEEEILKKEHMEHQPILRRQKPHRKLRSDLGCNCSCIIM
jgi:hypothetical protein